MKALLSAALVLLCSCGSPVDGVWFESDRGEPYEGGCAVVTITGSTFTRRLEIGHPPGNLDPAERVILTYEGSVEVTDDGVRLEGGCVAHEGTEDAEDRAEMCTTKPSPYEYLQTFEADCRIVGDTLECGRNVFYVTESVCYENFSVDDDYLSN